MLILINSSELIITYFRKILLWLMSVLQFYATNFIPDSGQLFDYNTQPYEEKEYFKSTVLYLDLPKPNKHVYYFFHKSLTKFSPKFIEVQRRKEFMSDIGKTSLNPKSYILLGGVKLFYKKTSKGIDKLCMNIYSGQEIPVQLGVFEIREKAVPFVVARCFEDGIPLKKDQIIKFGKVQYKLMEIQASPNKQQYLDSLQPHQIFTAVSSNSEIGQKTCRVCLMGDEQGNNLLIHPCKCQQSIGYIHIECMKTWMNIKVSNMKGDDKNGGAYHTNLLNCEICKEKYPKVIKVNEEIIPVMNFYESVKPYLGLALANVMTKDCETEPTIFITMDQKEKATIGRLEQNGVILNDITASRNHAVFELKKGLNFRVKDCWSKFGTLVYEKDAVIRLSKHIKAFQIKNTTFSFKLVELDKVKQE